MLPVVLAGLASRRRRRRRARADARAHSKSGNVSDACAPIPGCPLSPGLLFRLGGDGGMEAFELLGTIGEGTYGVVLKARHKESGQIVAIKKFKESDEAEEVRKTALREVRILKQLRHDHIVGLLDVFRRKRKLYLVFEFVESTLLQELERRPEGLDPLDTKKIMWQLVRGIDYLHQHQVIHRDIKPENLLLSRAGVLKLCDFGFARTLSGPGARYTDYVSTRCVAAASHARALPCLFYLQRPPPSPPPMHSRTHTRTHSANCN